MTIKTCVTCEKHFESKIPNKLYCSDECRTIDLTRKCIRCGEEFTVERRSRKKVYCSKSCAVSSNNELGIMGKNAIKKKDKFRVILKCDVCEKEFERIMSQVRKSQKKGSKHTFCGNECYQKHLSRNTEQRYCIECNAALPLNYKSKNKKFCSKECQHKHHTITFECTYCGRECTRGKANVANSNKRFCSRDCWRNYKLYESKSLDKSDYTSFRQRLNRLQEYIKWKKEVYEAYNHKCALCDEVEDLHVHHIIPLYRIIEEITNGIYNNEAFAKLLKSELLFNANNGILFCKSHHKLCHS